MKEAVAVIVTGVTETSLHANDVLERETAGVPQLSFFELTTVDSVIEAVPKAPMLMVMGE